MDANWARIAQATKRAAQHRAETKVEEKVATYAAETYGWESIKLNLHGHRSEPDRLFFSTGGRPLLIEFKRKGKKPEPLQQHTIAKRRGAGYAVATIDTTEEGCQVIDRWAAACADDVYTRSTARLEAARLSTEGCRVPVKPAGRRAVSGPRSRKDKHHPKSA